MYGDNEFHQQRLKDLRDSIYECLDIIKQYEDIFREASDPLEKKRYERELERQKSLLEKYYQQYNRIQRELEQCTTLSLETPSIQMEDISEHLDEIRNRLNQLFEQLKPPPPPIPPGEPVNEESQPPRGSYRKLRELLEDKKWKEADQETIRIILEVAKREKESWLRKQDIEIFPCSDLRTIDKLWLRYSNNQFGLSVQNNIWHNIGGNPQEFNASLFNELGDRLGWCETNKWLNYDNLIFTLESPEGHLPSLRLSEKSRKGSYTDLTMIFRGFLSRIVTCL